MVVHASVPSAREVEIGRSLSLGCELILLNQ